MRGHEERTKRPFGTANQTAVRKHTRRGYVPLTGCIGREGVQLERAGEAPNPCLAANPTQVAKRSAGAACRPGPRPRLSRRERVAFGGQATLGTRSIAGLTRFLDGRQPHEPLHHKEDVSSYRRTTQHGVWMLPAIPRQYAEEDMGPHPLCPSGPARSDVEVPGLQATKGPLNGRQTPVYAPGALCADQPYCR